MRNLARLLTAAALLLALPLTSASANGESLRIAALIGWPPFSADDLPNDGFSNDLTQTVLKRMGHDSKVSMMPWARALEMTKRGRYEVLPSVWYSDERAKELVFTDPIASNRIVFIKESVNDFEFDGLDSLTGKRIGIVQGYDYRDDFLQGEDFTLEATNDFITNVKKLLAGRVDLTVSDELVAKYAINKNLPKFANELAYTDGSLSEKTLHVTFSRDMPRAEQMAEAFNAELAKMREDGTYDAILARHGLK
jgi:polar amino acid transport system substrate-binding protein